MVLPFTLHCRVVVIAPKTLGGGKERGGLAERSSGRFLGSFLALVGDWTRGGTRYPGCGPCCQWMDGRRSWVLTMVVKV